jgi:poly(beta-D-mannuronate) lyase
VELQRPNFVAAQRDAVADPSIVKAYTPDTQESSPTGPEFFASLEFYRHRFPERKLPAAIEDVLKQPTSATRLGGNTTVLAGQ